MKGSVLNWKQSTVVGILVTGLVLSQSCRTDLPVPKPRTFPYMELPTRVDRKVELEECPFTFHFPDYGQLERNKKFFDKDAPHPCWFDLHIPAFNANLFFSYYDIASRQDFDRLVGDVYEIANHINKRSDYMEEIRIRNQSGVSGLKLRFEGDAASPLHFYLSDTTTHFVKGALYYNDRVMVDSMQPATEFILEDVDDLLNSLEWTTD